MAKRKASEAKKKEKKEKRGEATQQRERPAFPTAAIVRIIRANIQQGKMIKREVKEELNKWLADLVATISKKMDEYPYRSIDLWMLHEAIRPYVKIEELETEKERLIKQLEAIKAECDVLINEIDEQFSLRDRIARKLTKGRKD